MRPAETPSGLLPAVSCRGVGIGRGTLVVMVSESTAECKQSRIPPGTRVDVKTHIQRLLKTLTAAFASRETETLAVGEAQGKVCAAEVYAQHQLPGFDNSQMDGFAVRRADLQLQPAGIGESTSLTATYNSQPLPVSAVVAAGARPQSLTPGTAAAIMTGAPIPEGTDFIIPVEKTTTGFADAIAVNDASQFNNTVEFTALTKEDLTPGRFIRRAGSDVSYGQLLLSPGEVLTAAQLAVLAADGRSHVQVHQAVRTLVVATGAELQTPGEPLGSGQLYNANSTLLTAWFRSINHQVITLEVSTDDPQQFLNTLDAALDDFSPQLVITAGGISAGAFEVVRQALSPRGLQVTKVAQQPGGPQAWGLLNHPAAPGTESAAVAVIGLPGNPVSCAVSLETLIRPALHELDPGCPPQRRITVHSGEDLDSPAGVRQFRRVRLAKESAVVRAFAVGGPSSHLLGHLAASDALLEIPEDCTRLPAGTPCQALLLPGATIDPLPPEGASCL